MKKYIKIILSFCVSFFFLTFVPGSFIYPCYALSTKIFSSDRLIEESNQLDGKTIRFRGEIVGDILRRGTHCWINVYDGSQAIGVYSETKMVESIHFVGDYKHTGDAVEILGVFHKACQQHSGEMDIHAKQIRILKPGYIRKHPLSRLKLHIALILLFGAGFIVWLYIYRKKHSSSSASDG